MPWKLIAIALVLYLAYQKFGANSARPCPCQGEPDKDLGDVANYGNTFRS